MEISLEDKKYIVIGTLCKDLIFKTINTKYGNMEVCEFSLLTEKTQEKTLFMRIHAKGKIAQSLKAVTRGMILMIVGFLKTQEYIDKNNENKTKEYIDAKFIIQNGVSSIEKSINESNNSDEDSEDDLPF